MDFDEARNTIESIFSFTLVLMLFHAISFFGCLLIFLEITNRWDPMPEMNHVQYFSPEFFIYFFAYISILLVMFISSLIVIGPYLKSTKDWNLGYISLILVSLPVPLILSMFVYDYMNEGAESFSKLLLFPVSTYIVVDVLMNASVVLGILVFVNKLSSFETTIKYMSISE